MPSRHPEASHITAAARSRTINNGSVFFELRSEAADRDLESLPLTAWKGKNSLGNPSPWVQGTHLLRGGAHPAVTLDSSAALGRPRTARLRWESFSFDGEVRGQTHAQIN